MCIKVRFFLYLLNLPVEIYWQWEVVIIHFNIYIFQLSHKLKMPQPRPPGSLKEQCVRNITVNIDSFWCQDYIKNWLDQSKSLIFVLGPFEDLRKYERYVKFVIWSDVFQMGISHRTSILFSQNIFIFLFIFAYFPIFSIFICTPFVLIIHLKSIRYNSYIMVKENLLYHFKEANHTIFFILGVSISITILCLLYIAIEFSI